MPIGIVSAYCFFAWSQIASPQRMRIRPCANYSRPPFGKAGWMTASHDSKVAM